MSAKTKKILNIVVDAVVTIILIFVVILAVSAITSKAKGYKNYTEIFGKAYLAVESDSMVGSGSDNFSKGDLITIKVLSSDSEKRSLKEGDIVTFTSKVVNGQYELISHRVVKVNYNADGTIVKNYWTHGDNNPDYDENYTNCELVSTNDVVGVYQSKSGGIGWLFIFMSSSTGFFVCIVLPSLLIVVYFAINLILVIRKEKKVQTAAADEEKQQELNKEREKMRAELLAELAAEKSGGSGDSAEGAGSSVAKPDDSCDTN
jgi:signal peptidase